MVLNGRNTVSPVIVSLFVVATSFAAPPAAQKANSSKPIVNAATTQPASPYSEIDAAFAELKPDLAKTLTEAKLKTEPKDPGLLWRLSRALVAAGDKETDKAKQLVIYEKARELADQSIALDPSLMSAYLRRAISAGKIALFKGVLETRELVLSTKKDSEKAIELNNATPYEFALGHYLLGRVHLKLSETPKVVRMPLGLAWGNIDEAEKFLAKSIELYPDAPGFRVDYALALIKRDKKEDAKTQLKKAIELKPLDVSDLDRIQEAKKILAGL